MPLLPALEKRQGGAAIQDANRNLEKEKNQPYWEEGGRVPALLV